MKKKRILLGIALASASIFALASCGSSNNNNPEKPQDQETGGDEQSNKVTITFNTNGGGTISSQTIDKGDKATAPANPTKDGFVFLGWYASQDGSGDAFDFNTAVNANITLYAKWKVYDPFEDYVAISTAEELVKFINADESYLTDTEKKESTKNIMLTADIDLADVPAEDLIGASIYFKGIFDGRGHVIKNATVDTGTKVKTGLLFEQLLGNAVVKNLRFLGCNIKGSGESVGIVAGLCDGDVTFDGIEFNACSTTAGADYSGLLFARNTAVKTITIKNITAKNNCSSTCSKYGGLVVGDIVGNTTVSFENLDVNGSFTSSGNGSMVTGRARAGAKVTIKNAVVTGKVSSNQLGAVTGGDNALGSLAVENVYANVENADQMFKSKFSDIVSPSITNVYSKIKMKEKIGEEDATTVYADAVTVAWLKDTLHLDFTNTWMTEGENNAKYRLVNSTTNVKSADATLSRIYAVTGGAKTRYHKGDDFSAQNLVVMAAYSDGVQLVMQSDEYNLNSTAYDKTTKGTYNIVISSTADSTKTTDYNVNVVEQTGFEINTLEVNKLFTKGTDFSKDGLGVYSIWSDNVKELEAAPTIDSTAYNKNAAGEYEISVSHGGFAAQTYKVSVVDTAPVVVDDYFYVNVDASATGYSGQKVNGVETFKSLGDAVAYLTAYKTQLANATKVIRVAPGVYREKVTIGLDNVVLVGTGTNAEQTQIVNDAVESTYSIALKKGFGLECATIHVNGKNFKAENISIFNDFNYIQDAAKEASPQGLALTINGDKAVLDNVHLYGNQDTFYVKSGRVYVNNSKIEGNVDFIFGENNGLVYFNECTINAVYRGKEKNNGYVTAMRAGRDGGGKEITPPTYGYIFNNCTFTADDEVNDHTMGLGRPWGDKATVAFINCSFTKAYAILGYKNAEGKDPRWADMSGNSPANAKFVEYGSTGEGAITTAVAGGSVLTAEQAANYTVANLFAPTNGGVTWKVNDVDDPFDYQAALTALATEKTIVPAISIKVSSPQDDATTTDVIDVSVERNKTFDISYYVSPWNAENKAVEFEYDNTKLEFDAAAGTVKGLAEGATTFVVKQGTVSTTVNVTVTAPTGTNTVTFMDGSTVLGTKTGAAGDTIDFSSIVTTKAGYQFARWYEDSTFTKEYIDTEFADSDKTVYARYIELNVTGVTYVTTAAELKTALNTSDAKITLLNDIDMTSITDFAGHTTDTTFTGELNGYGYTISNLSFTLVKQSSDKQQGIFGTLNGKVDSVKFKDCSVNTTSDDTKVVKYFSFLAGKIAPTATVTNLTFDGVEVNGAATTQYVSLLADSITTSGLLTVKNITLKDVVVNGSKYTGGLFCRGGNTGYNIKVDGLYGNIQINVSDASNGSCIGGVISNVKNSSFELDNADISVKIVGTEDTGSQQIGGVVGYMQQDGGEPTVIITNSTINADISKVGKTAGGLVGYIQTKNSGSGESTLTITDVTVNAKIAALNASGARIGGVVGGTKAQATTTALTATLTNVNANVDITSASGRVGGINGSDESIADAITFTMNNVKVAGSITADVNDKLKAFVVQGNNTFDYSKCYYVAGSVTITGASTAVAVDQGTAISATITDDLTITFGDSGNYLSSTITPYYISTATLGTGNAGNSQAKQGTIKFTVAAGATVVITSYDGLTHYTVAIDDGAASSDITNAEYTIDPTTAQKTITIDCDPGATGNNYIISIAVTF